MVRSGKGLIISLGFNTNINWNKIKKSRFSITNVSLKGFSKIIQEFKDLHNSTSLKSVLQKWFDPDNDILGKLNYNGKQLSPVKFIYIFLFFRWVTITRGSFLVKVKTNKCTSEPFYNNFSKTAKTRTMIFMKVEMDWKPIKFCEIYLHIPLFSLVTIKIGSFWLYHTHTNAH